MLVRQGFRKTVVEPLQRGQTLLELCVFTIEVALLLLLQFEQELTLIVRILLSSGVELLVSVFYLLLVLIN